VGSPLVGSTPAYRTSLFYHTEETNGIPSMLDFLTDRGIVELSFWWAGVAMPFATVLAILYARKQLTVIANQAQATLLLDLVEKWNSEKMHESKSSFTETESKVKSDIYSQHHGLSDKEVMNKLKERFRGVIDDLEKTDIQKYFTMMRMMSFFETVGKLVRRRYVALDDVDGLFRGPILDVGVAWVLHIKDKQKEKGVPPGLYENALFLISEIEKICPQ
jgi:hypothetical protein